MRSEQRKKFLAELDGEQRWFQKAGQHVLLYRMWLRDVRQALGIPVSELEEKLNLRRSTLYRLELREKAGQLRVAELEKVAAAMGCRLVYCIVPRQGTLADAVERRKMFPWREQKRIREAVDARFEKQGVTPSGVQRLRATLGMMCGS